MASRLAGFTFLVAWLGAASVAAQEPSTARVAPPLSQSLLALHDEGPTAWARAELVVGQVLHGFAQGMASCNIGSRTSCPDGDTSPFAGLFGAAVGGGASFLLSSRGVRPGQAMVVNAGTLWGAGEGVFLSMAINMDRNPSTAAMIGMAMGTGMGVVIALALAPDAAQVAWVDSGTLWAGLLGFFAAALASNSNGQALGIAEVVSLNVGLAGSVVAGRWVRMSRGRLFVIDGVGLIGLLAGLAGAAYASSNLPRESAAVSGSLVAAPTLAALGLATYLTRDFDEAQIPLHVSLVPGSSGVAGVSLVGAF